MNYNFSHLMLIKQYMTNPWSGGSNLFCCGDDVQLTEKKQV